MISVNASARARGCRGVFAIFYMVLPCLVDERWHDESVDSARIWGLQALTDPKLALNHKP